MKLLTVFNLYQHTVNIFLEEMGDHSVITTSTPTLCHQSRLARLERLLKYVHLYKTSKWQKHTIKRLILLPIVLFLKPINVSFVKLKL